MGRGTSPASVAATIGALARRILHHPRADRLRQALSLETDPAGRLYSLLQWILLRSAFFPANEAGPALLPDDPLEALTGGAPLDLDDAKQLTGRDPGEVYQELLSLEPTLDPTCRELTLVRVAGSARKRSGSYYTPAVLVERLLRSALDPAIEEALSQANPEVALLALRVCDPACGSGHFLLAAARRIAHVLAQLRGKTEAESLKQVIARCVHGVDRDPLAAALCRLALWRDGGESFALIANVRCGNSLVGSLEAGEANDLDAWAAHHLGGGGAVESLRDSHGFFHWGREFPEPFDVLLGNPPWERVKFQAKEWLTDREDQTRARECARTNALQLSRFLRRSGRFPLSARGDLNYYGPFIETSRRLVRPGGRIGLVVPSGIATDESMKDLFQSLSREDLVSWYDFHNRTGLFPGVQGNTKFGLLTLGPRNGERFQSAAQLSRPEQLDEPGRIWSLSPAQLSVVNPNTLHLPPFAGVRDAELVGRIHERFEVLVRESLPASNRWGVRPWTMFHMTKDRPHFRREEELRAEGWLLKGNVFRRGRARYLPLYESKLIGPFTHRAATFAGVPEAVRFRTHARTRPLNGDESALPRYWVAEEEVRRRARGARWFLGFRNAISAVADTRSLVAAIIPRSAVGNSLPLLAVPDARSACLLLALLNSFVLDYVLRQKASGGNLNFHVLKQLPVPGPEVFDRPCPWSIGESLADWIVPRVAALTCTTDELAGFTQESGHAGPSNTRTDFRGDTLRAELDAACFRLYGLDRDEIERVMRSFAILEKRERNLWGRFRSSDTIRESLDAQESGEAGLFSGDPNSGEAARRD